jgi:hypothetical protein
MTVSPPREDAADHPRLRIATSWPAASTGW